MTQCRKRELFNDANEAPKARTDDLQNFKRQIGIFQAHGSKIVAGNKYQLRLFTRHSRCGISSPIEDGKLRYGRAGALDCQHLFAASVRHIEYPDSTGYDHKEPAAGLSLGKQQLSG
jgi:hypothetical protein